MHIIHIAVHDDNVHKVMRAANDAVGAVQVEYPGGSVYRAWVEKVSMDDIPPTPLADVVPTR